MDPGKVGLSSVEVVLKCFNGCGVWAAVFTSLFPMVPYSKCAVMSSRNCVRLPVFCRYPVIRYKKYLKEIKSFSTKCPKPKKS